MRAWLGLGSNIGDRLANLRAAVDALPRHRITVVAVSDVYETEAREGAAGQGDFLNACALVETALDPETLLDACKAVERELGRRPGPRHAARPIDVDLLLVDGPEHASERLRVPHPQIAARRFVLEPLLELDPPGREALQEALAAVEDQRVTRCCSLST